MSEIGIIAAFAGELKPLVRGWTPVRPAGLGKGESAWRGELAGVRCIAVCAGMGRDAAARACAAAFAAGNEVAALISVGWAGALSCGLGAGQAYRVAEVVDAGTGERFASEAPGAGATLRLVTLDHVARAEEKRRLAQSYQAVMVDMEAATVARLARSKGIGFSCVKAVSDGQREVLPDFGRFTDHRGKLRWPGLLGHVAVRPKYWRGLVRMERNARAGAEAIAAELSELVKSGVYADTRG